MKATALPVPCTITHRDLRLGDIVYLGCTPYEQMMAQVTRISTDPEPIITLIRPWIVPSTDGYPRMGFELFTVFKNSDKTVILVERRGSDSV